MNSRKYKSSIPRTARERILARHPNGAKREAEYLVGGKVVGRRSFFESGDLELEQPLKDGKKHGVQYDWIGPGVLSSAEPFVDGLPHGTTRQWDHLGRLIGTYRMVRGTGIDLWRQPREEGEPYLSEVLHVENGLPHGFEWWIEESQTEVWIERHWQDGRLHGIERQWSLRQTGSFARGYPKYHVAGKTVTKRQYLKAAMRDPTLPPFRPQDNRPARTFPPEIARHLRFKQRTIRSSNARARRRGGS